ncbi:MAG: RDD family protein [Defluviitaleaceae bacterium]|nr:RDD family protein [Defluviitaleaceae bacterium]
MKIIRRLLANFVDIFIFITTVVLFFIFIVPLFVPEDGALGMPMAGLVLLVICALNFLLQYPFMAVNQTLGKAMMGLRITSTNDERPLTLGIVLQRELFAKVLTCYLMCAPVLFGREGKHDEVCETEVV